MDMYAPEEVKPKEELRFAFVREQGFDRSCGYSAVASLLSLYWGLDLDEKRLIEKYASEDLATERLEVNFSGLAKILSDCGFAVKGVRMDWEQLEAALAEYAPVIVHYVRPDRHFVLALRARADWIITLDPALGCEIQSRLQFMERWSGVALLATSPNASRDEGFLAEAVRVGMDRRELLERLGR